MALGQPRPANPRDRLPISPGGEFSVSSDANMLHQAFAAIDLAKTKTVRQVFSADRDELLPWFVIPAYCSPSPRPHFLA